MSEQAAHPIYATKDPQIIAEYERERERANEWQRMFARCDSEAERFQIALEEIADRSPSEDPIVTRDMARAALIAGRVIRERGASRKEETPS